MEKAEKIEKKEPHEFVIKNELIEKREKIKTFDELIDFLADVKDNYNCGYGEAPRAIAQAALAVAWYLSSEFGITGFQASCTMFDFLEGWKYINNKCGLRIIDYDKMLFPQYEEEFANQAISPRLWENLQKEANRLLKEESAYTHLKVINHWESIVNGEIPFNCVVKDD